MERWPEFWETARILEHDRERLPRGEEEVEFLRLETLPRARACLSRADAERRKNRPAPRVFINEEPPWLNRSYDKNLIRSLGYASF